MKLPSFESAHTSAVPRRASRRRRRARATHMLIRLAGILCAADLLMMVLWR